MNLKFNINFLQNVQSGILIYDIFFYLFFHKTLPGFIQYKNRGGGGGDPAQVWESSVGGGGVEKTDVFTLTIFSP